MVDDVISAADDIRDKFTKMQGLEEKLGMLKTLEDLKKEIQLTRNVANRVCNAPKSIELYDKISSCIPKCPRF